MKSDVDKRRKSAGDKRKRDVKSKSGWNVKERNEKPRDLRPSRDSGGRERNEMKIASICDRNALFLYFPTHTRIAAQRHNAKVTEIVSNTSRKSHLIIVPLRLHTRRRRRRCVSTINSFVQCHKNNNQDNPANSTTSTTAAAQDGLFQPQLPTSPRLL